jgi:hypothetical protein
VKVGHCQALNLMEMKPSPTQVGEGFFVSIGVRQERYSAAALAAHAFVGSLRLGEGAAAGSLCQL